MSTTPMFRRWPRWLARGQGWFYIVSGLWPIVSPGTFQAITGPKLDAWLMQTVGLLLALEGGVIVLAAHADRLTREIKLLAGGTAFLLGCVDLYCVTQPRTTRAYLLDAVVEFALTIAWIVAVWRSRSRRGERAAG